MASGDTGTPLDDRCNACGLAAGIDCRRADCGFLSPERGTYANLSFARDVKAIRQVMDANNVG